jgi:hypothetical protein
MMSGIIKDEIRDKVLTQGKLLLVKLHYYESLLIYICCKLMFDSQLLNMKKRGKINSKLSEICRAGNEGTRRMLLNPTVLRFTSTQMSSGSSSKVRRSSDNNGECDIVIAL